MRIKIAKDGSGNFLLSLVRKKNRIGPKRKGREGRITKNKEGNREGKEGKGMKGEQGEMRG